jgi:acyl-coenzyme A thioesterase PaaI-like protein
VTPIDLFAKIYDLPAAVRNPLLSAGIPRVIPIARGLKIAVVQVDDDGAELMMPFTRRSANHVGSMYIGALLILAEATMATYVVRLCRPPAFRVLVKRSEADFTARATGRVGAVFSPTAEERDAFERCRKLERGEKAEAWATVKLTGLEVGAAVSEMRFLVSVKRAA